MRSQSSGLFSASSRGLAMAMAPSGEGPSSSTKFEPTRPTIRPPGPDEYSPSARMSQSGSNHSGYIGSPFRSAINGDSSRRQFVWQANRGLVSTNQLQREQQIAQPAPQNEAERILQMLEGISTVSKQ